MNDQNDFTNVHEDTINTKNDDKSHPWRRCSIGKHFVKEHILHDTRKVREHCAFNPSHKEELSYDEIQYITQKYFNDLPGAPTALSYTGALGKNIRSNHKYLYGYSMAISKASFALS